MTKLPDDWRKSSFSGEETDCVEINMASPNLEIRDSKNPTGPRINANNALFIKALKES